MLPSESISDYLVFIILTFIASILFIMNDSISTVGYVILAITYIIAGRFTISTWSVLPPFQLFEWFKTLTFTSAYMTPILTYSTLLLVAFVIVGLAVDIVLVNKYMITRASIVDSLDLRLSKHSNNNRKAFNITLLIALFTLIMVYCTIAFSGIINTVFNSKLILFSQGILLLVVFVSVILNMIYTYRLRTIVHDSKSKKQDDTLDTDGDGVVDAVDANKNGVADNIENEYDKRLKDVYGQNAFTDLWQRLRIFFSNP